MDKIADFLTALINNENYVNAISIFVVAFTSYQVAKYNALKPNKLKIKQQQLEKVYLPLIRISLDLPKTLSPKQALEIQQKIDKILDEHYELAYPQLHQLNDELVKSIHSSKGYCEILNDIFHQVSIDYELLKKQLGYPSENMFNLFIRMTKRKKVEFLLGHLNVMGLCFIIVFLCSNYIAGKQASSELSVYLIPGISFLLFLLNVYYQRLK